MTKTETMDKYTRTIVKAIRELRKKKIKFEMNYTIEKTIFTYPDGEIVINRGKK